MHQAFREIPVLRCNDCTFLYASRILSDEVMRGYYDGFAGERQKCGQIVNSTVNVIAVEKLLRGREYGSFLDVGTGYGFLLDLLRKRRQLETAGVELSQQEASFARESLQLDVRQSMLDKAGFEPESFDVVGSFETIEHVPRPVEFVQQLGDYVRPGKYLLINTDNFESWAVRELGPEFPKWIPHTHISDFAPKTLTECINQDGRFKIVDTLSYTNWELLVKAWRSKLSSESLAAQDAFDLESTLSQEMQGGYRLYNLRKALNGLWFRLTHRRDLNAGLMFVLAQKVA